jgi:hypothetical protein
MSVTTMGLAGLLTGLVLGLLRLRRRSGETVPDEHEASAQPH